MRHLTKDLVPCAEAKKQHLKPAELCAIWRNAPYRLAFNELTQEVELDGRPLSVADIEEAYIGLSEVGYESNPKTATDTVLKVAREGRYHPVQRISRSSNRTNQFDLSTYRPSRRITSGLQTRCMTRCGLPLCLVLCGGCFSRVVSSTLS